MAFLDLYRLFILLPLLSLQFECSAKDTPLLGAASTLNKDCPCGFYDGSTGSIFTESLIVYFNETTSFPSDEFTIETYQHKYEKDWNAIYREGANSSNVVLVNASASTRSSVFNGSSLEMYIDSSDKNHLVIGSEIKSIRQDMQYGSFSALVRGPPKSNRGSVMSMMFQHNESQEWEMDLMNTNSPETAWLATLFADEFPDRDLGVNYSTLADTSLSNYTSSPWDFVDLNVNWDAKSINFSIGGVVSRSVTRKSDSTVPSVPGPFMFRHWSDGNKYSSQGPPYARTEANVGWVRTFFNASTTTKEAREDFDAKCHVNSACSVDDITLRGSTSYTSSATVPWKQKESNYALKIFAIVIVSVGSAICAVVIFNAFARKFANRRRMASLKKEAASSPSSSETAAGKSSGSSTGSDINLNGSPGPAMIAHSASYSTLRSSDNTATAVNSRAASVAGPSRIQTAVNSRAPSISSPVSSPTAGGSSYSLPLERNEHQSLGFAPFEVDAPKETQTLEKEDATVLKVVETSKGKVAATTTDVTGPPPAPAVVPIQPVRQRVDYMAGLVALCSTLVTWSHFALTFLPSLDSGTDAHYPSELWARKTIGPYTLNAIWLGLFFTTSTRFLTTAYLRTGNLKAIAEKTVARPFRLMIPVTGVIVLEYFLIDAGATKWLQYLPSITWSTWPYVVQYQNFGTFLNEVLELFYLIPNAAPQVTFNYCTGVLWTIPVSLQGSWVVLLGVVLIREIKTPWKRFGYYTFCLIVNWYARAWGGYFWAGLILADMDIVYKYRKWLYPHRILHWVLCFSCLALAILMLSTDVVQVDSGLDILSLERGIHPDWETGRPLSQTPRAGYPDYYEPRLNGLIFAFVAQLGVEISPSVQKILSSPIFMWIFPHIFTIYLFHGLIFWTLGSVICVHLSVAGIPYWANMLVTAVVCYGVLFAALEVVTPCLEMLGKHVTAMIWRQAYETPAEKKPTLFPFEKQMLLGRAGADPEVIEERDEHIEVEQEKNEKELDPEGKKVPGKSVDEEKVL
ncbi:hypothetical protein LSUE1_G005121 [Lachnellula suecica]|uniref:GH16 domain-containing protein n=1 Tax=Lachnellula suecica TaxID=602035 RepID=A0A8T9C1J4_9HELO|nr:hypothetical protein LSUE1_G005121 [Lachnellula suecica]